MIVTEEEAKTKTCPQPEMLCCIGTECMAWRWAHMRHFPEPANTAGFYPDNQGYLARRVGDDMKPLGFCGKAGAP